MNIETKKRTIDYKTIILPRIAIIQTQCNFVIIVQYKQKYSSYLEYETRCLIDLTQSSAIMQMTTRWVAPSINGLRTTAFLKSNYICEPSCIGILRTRSD